MSTSSSRESAFFTFDGTHHAMAAEDILRCAGVPLEVVPPPADLSPGCGLALKIDLEFVPAALAALQSRGATYAAVHRPKDEQSAIRAGAVGRPPTSST